ncbi:MULTISPECIES: hypothetical protein [unclassified Treponema]|uniref:hypothetical protein n=1 Tax=unclassified Treponema TaxID=2638727 RepID=UPI0005300F50|nr:MULTISPECIES: hypothetical protein [unclassified Treponema]AIW89322.1 hypothetical protein JO41_05435 [Treponema sp. OMZ 838]UTC50639.1 hypothetical protein E4N65_11485 [Treponema sp. OMZ 855]
MKKLLFISMFALLASSFTFAAAKGTGGGNGNGGKDKIGGYIGSPFGLSYSHEFNDLVEFDLVAGYSGLFSWNHIDIQLGALFTVWDPVLSGLGNQHCPLSLGPVIGGSFDFYTVPYYGGTYKGGSIYVLLPVRWELNFGNIPDFNIFLDWAPVGVSINFHPDYYDGRIHTSVWYATRFGIGLRYRIPGKK